MTNNRIQQIFRPALLCSALMLLSGNSTADTMLLVGGSTSRDADYAYVGAIIPIGSKLNENGLRVRVWGEHLSYDYGSGATAHSASATGTALGLGYRFGLSPSAAVTVGINARHRNTNLSLPDPFNKESGSHTRGVLSLDGQFVAADKVNVLFDVERQFSPNAYWARARVPFVVTSGGLTLGPEVSAHGSSQYHARLFGLVLGGLLPSGKGADLSFLLGTSKISKRSSTGYGGVEFVYQF